MRKHSSLRLFVLLSVPHLIWAQTEARRFTLEDLLSVEPIGETALSPDGKAVALTRNGQIVLMPADGGWPVMLTSNAGGKAGLNWSPNGRSIAYASSGSIWSVPAAGGTPRRMTRSLPGEGDPRSSGDRNPQWSPDSRWILYETGRRGHDSLMVVSANGTTDNFLTDSSADEGAASWSPDGAHISYTERTPQSFSGKLKVIDVDGKTGQPAGDPATLYSAPTDRGGSWSLRKAQWSPDSKSLAVILQESGWDHVYLIGSKGGTPRALTQGAFEDTSPVFSPDGARIAFVSSRNSLESSAIFVQSVSGGEAHVLTHFSTPGIESQPEWSADGRELYFHRSSPLESTDLYVMDLKSKAEPRKLTNTLPLNLQGMLRVPDRVEYKSTDGQQISGMLYKPHSWKAGTRFPAVLWIHGGPEGQDNYRLDLWAQYLAQSGYAVLEPNYRGSTGYGEKFRNLNVEDSGGGEMDDVAAGAQYLVDSGIADGRRLAIGGGSHGGTMVAYAVTKYPDLFQAAIELYGVVDRASFLERTNRASAVRWAMKMGGSPAEKPELYQKANVLLQVDKIKTPLLIMHGENDPQVPPFESAQFTRALKEHGKTFFYFTYPGELHGFSQRDHRLDAWKKQLTFLNKYINPKYGQSSTSLDELTLEPAPKPAGRAENN